MKNVKQHIAGRYSFQKDLDQHLREKATPYKIFIVCGKVNICNQKFLSASFSCMFIVALFTTAWN